MKKAKNQINKKIANQNDKYCWHYTTGQKFMSIVESGAIYTEAKTTPIQIQGMVDVVWFSTNQKWEPTSAKGIIDEKTGHNRSATRGEMIRLAGGLVRFGISVDSSFLLTWDEWKEKCTCEGKIIKNMEKTAQRQGANVKNFRACVNDVPRVLWEVIDIWENGKWVRVSFNDEVAEAA